MRQDTQYHRELNRMADQDQKTEIAAPETGVTEPQPVRLRLWPGVLAAAALWTALTLPAALFPESPRGFLPLYLGSMASYVLFALWWLLASRTPWLDRVIGFTAVSGMLLLCITLLYHPSVPGMPLMFFIGPWIVAAVVAAFFLTKPLGWRKGRWLSLAVALAAILLPSLVRFTKVDSAFNATFLPRWEQSSEEKLVDALAENSGDLAAADIELAEVSPDDWPGFRGANRDGHVSAQALGVSWENESPQELWRSSIGPGWGSFCIVGKLAFTQEQRGEEECIVAYEADTGDQVWSTGIEARFEESVAGPGPRATPTFDAGSLLVTGAAGDIMRLDASSGEILWQRKLTEDTARDTPPMWGFASSPLVVEAGNQKLALVYAGNPQPEPGTPEDAASENRSVIAYDFATGDPVWNRGVGFHGYSSPHLASLGGVEQVLVSSNKGLESFDPTTGERLWLYDWSIGEFPRSTQPLIVDDQTVVLSAGYDSGTIAIRVTKEGQQWTAKEIWDKPSRHLEPYFNDLVLYEGHLYGIHKKYLVCISLETGEPTWPKKIKRKTKFGNGQLVLDPASGTLLVTNETNGEVLLIEANPETLVIRGQIEALEPDTHWNHPVVAGGRLYLRNGQEAVCYKLPAGTGAVAGR